MEKEIGYETAVLGTDCKTLEAFLIQTGIPIKRWEGPVPKNPEEFPLNQNWLYAFAYRKCPGEDMLHFLTALTRKEPNFLTVLGRPDTGVASGENVLGKITLVLEDSLYIYALHEFLKEIHRKNRLDAARLLDNLRT